MALTSNLASIQMRQVGRFQILIRAAATFSSTLPELRTPLVRSVSMVSFNRWGPGDGSPNGLPPASPVGGNFVASDGAFQQGAISQTLSGLTPGAHYTVSFWWAAAEQNDRTGASQSQWLVSFGSQTQSTTFASIASQGFSGWMSQSFTFTADSTSDVLSFLANGSPAGVPSFALLDGVSVAQHTTPEPSTLMLMGTGMVGVFRLVRRYYSNKRG